MTIIEVEPGQKNWKLFHKVPRVVYRSNPYWICPFEGEIDKIFNPEENKVFDEGEAKCFVLLAEDQTPIGRIAASSTISATRFVEKRLGGLVFLSVLRARKQPLHFLKKRRATLLTSTSILSMVQSILANATNFGGY